MSDTPKYRVNEASPAEQSPIAEAVRIMHEARQRGQWEREMTHESLIPFLQEESQELIDAIRSRAGEDDLKKELSDLLLQVLFHAELAAERGAFTFDDVAAAFVEKMRSRAPYLFDESTGVVEKSVQDRLWQEGKARERESER